MRKLFILFFMLACVSLSYAQGTTYGFDLSLSDFQVTYDRNPIYEGDVVNLKVTVTNNSEVSVSWRNISFYCGETLLSSMSIYPALAPGASIPIEVNWTARLIENGEFSVASPDDDNMADNKLIHSGEVEVVRKYANELILSDFSISSGEEIHTFYEGDEIDISMKIANQGRDNQQNIEVNLYKGDEVIDTKTILSLEAEGEETVTFNYTAALGFDMFKVVIPEDENIANNEASRMVFIFPEGIMIESFEGGTFPPAGWTTGSAWSRAAYGGYHGDYYASCYFAASYTGEKKLITPKLDIQAGDSLNYAVKISFAYQMRVLTSTNMLEWEEIATHGGDNTYATHQILFNQEEYTHLVGKRYFAFELVNATGAFSMDLIYGSRIAPVEDDFELTELSTTGFLQEGGVATFNFTVRNNGAVPGTKAIYLKQGGELLATGTTGLIQAGEEKTVSLEWTPTEASLSLTFEGSVEADDADGNNFRSLTTKVYPVAELPLYESFEQSTAITTGYPYWVVNNRASGAWRISTGFSIRNPTSTPYDGVNVLNLYCTGNNIASDFITPLYALPHDKYTVSFRLFRDSHAANLAKADKVNLYVNTDPETTNATLLGTVHRSTNLAPVVEDGDAWYLYSYEVDARELSQGFFILEGIAEGSLRNIFIDSLTITGISEYDLAVTGISPAEGSLLWGNENAVKTVKATIKNTGINTMQSATIRWSINDEQQEDVVWNGSLAASETTEVVLGENVLFETGRDNTIRVEVVSELDKFTGNNVLEVNVESVQAILLPYENSFEEETSLDRWLTLDEDEDDFTWLKGTVTPQDGTTSMVSYSFDELANEALTPDNWLISPGIYVEYNKVFLSFYVGTGDAIYKEETYEVLISTTDPEPQEFVSLHKETLTDNRYKQVTLELDGYSGKTVFLAFRHVESTDNFYLTIDNISLLNPELYTVVATANPSNAGTITGDGVYENESEVTVVATANDGYEFINWTAGGVEKSDETSYTFTVTEDIHLTANFSVISFTIDASVEGEGTITPSGTVSVDYGQSMTFEIEAAEGWIISDVLVNNSSVGVVSSYTFENITADQSIKAVFNQEAATDEIKIVDVKVYPNPTNNMLWIRKNNDTVIRKVRLFDFTGKLIYQTNDVNTNEFSIDLSRYGDGIYFLDIDDNITKVVKY